MARRILVIEDDDGVAQLVATVLEEDGYAVDRVSTPDDGLLRVRADRPDLVLLDLTVIEATGCWLLHTCKSDESLANLPIVVMTDAAMAPLGREPAPDGEIVKPFDIDDLCRTVRQLIGAGSTLAEGAPS